MSHEQHILNCMCAADATTCSSPLTHMDLCMCVSVFACRDIWDCIQVTQSAVLWSHARWSEHVFCGLSSPLSVWGDCIWHICSQPCIVSWPVQQSAILRNWRILKEVRWHIMAVKKGVNNGLSHEAFSGSFSPPLASGSGSICITHYVFHHEWEICLLKIPLRTVQYVHLCITLEWLMCALAIVSILGARALQG